MPKFSVVVAAYNIEKYVGRCIRSLKDQSLDDFEAIVVDDCSTDGTLSVIEAETKTDDRFIVVKHEQNQGTHIVRKDGVSRATGEFMMFLDGDDELTPDFLENLYQRCVSADADIVHFGITVVPEGVSKEECDAFEANNNRPSGVIRGSEVLARIFSEDEGQRMDWRVTQRAYRTAFLQRAFSLMTSERLDRAEDGYECFVVAAEAQSSVGAEDIRGYVYHYGCGVTGESKISSERFGEFARSFRACVDASRNYTCENGSPNVCKALDGFEHKMYELLANDWNVRVPEGEKDAAAQLLAEHCGASVAARELWRFVRDRAYAFVDGKGVPADDDRLWDLAAHAEKIRVTDDVTDEDGMRFRDMRRTARYYLRELSCRRRFQKYDEQDVRILVTAHKRVSIPDSLILQPVQVGPSNKADRFVDYLHDDEGENISSLNPMYCELTTQYWAWKNVKSDYVGFCHYRRYFNFTDTFYEENAYGEVMDGSIDAAAAKKYGLDDETIKRCVDGYDVITTGFHDLREFPGEAGTPREQYKAAERLHFRDIEAVAQIVKEMHPDYAADVDNFLDGHLSCFCNMYIMRRQIFSAYCEWLFPILERFCAQADMSHYSKEALRTPGHLAERLFNIYYKHAMRTNACWKTKQLQCVHFEKPEEKTDLAPLVEWEPDLVRGKRLIPVVFASDDGYVPMLTTTIGSMLQNASEDYFYDIVVLQRNIAYEHRRAMESYLKRYPNAKLRFYDVTDLISGYDLATNNAHISMETYYRFLVQKIFAGYDRVLYLDSDLIIRGDVSELFNVDLGDNLLAAARDVDYLGNLNMPDGKRMEYTTTKLGMDNPYDYFQAGVLVLNTREMRKLHTVPEWMEIVSKSDFIYDDQDILNAECQGRVHYLPADWNVMHDCAGRVAKVFTWAPNEVFDAYNASRNDPKIIHYAGFEKPWVNPDCDFASIYWTYARMTPFYEMLIDRLAQGKTDEAKREAIRHSDFALDERVPRHEKAVSEDSPIRSIVDPIAPFGTRRREALKAIGRVVRGKK
jgi:lipopolysaccharide biosynthesis glycosyltransferase/glycosyltransferase involved in cell wall biosynthesis